MIAAIFMALSLTLYWCVRCTAALYCRTVLPLVLQCNALAAGIGAATGQARTLPGALRCSWRGAGSALLFVKHF